MKPYIFPFVMIVILLTLLLYYLRYVDTESFIVADPKYPSFYQYCSDKGGVEFGLTEGEYLLADLKKAAGIENVDLQIAQVEVPIGWKVVLFEGDNFQGKNLVMMKSECLISSKFDNKTKSIKVSKIPILYQHCEMQGWNIALDVGKYTLNTLRQLRSQSTTAGDFKNAVSSLIVPYGFKVTLYTKDNFDGDSLDVTQDIFCLSDYNFDDKAISVVVDRYPVLYELCNNQGWSLALVPGRYTSSDLTALLKKRMVFKKSKGILGSVYIPDGYKVTLWETDTFQGRNLTLDNSMKCMKGNPMDGFVSAVEIQVIDTSKNENTDNANDAKKCDDDQ